MGEVIEGVSKKNANGLYTQDDILACSLGTELDRKTIFYGLRSTEVSVKSYRIVNIGNVIYTKSPIKGYPNGIVRTCKIVDGIVPSLYCVYKKRKIYLFQLIQDLYKATWKIKEDLINICVH